MLLCFSWGTAELGNVGSPVHLREVLQSELEHLQCTAHLGCLLLRCSTVPPYHLYSLASPPLQPPSLPISLASPNISLTLSHLPSPPISPPPLPSLCSPHCVCSHHKSSTTPRGQQRTVTAGDGSPGCGAPCAGSHSGCSGPEQRRGEKEG